MQEDETKGGIGEYGKVLHDNSKSVIRPPRLHSSLMMLPSDWFLNDRIGINNVIKIYENQYLK